MRHGTTVYAWQAGPLNIDKLTDMYFLSSASAPK